MSTWRVGRKVGRTVYQDDELIGVMDTAELAEKVVRAVNLADAQLEVEAQVEAVGEPFERTAEWRRAVLALATAVDAYRKATQGGDDE